MLQKVVFVLMTYLVACHARADEPMKVCSSGQQKVMIAYEFPEDNAMAFGNVFVCTSKEVNTEAGLTSLRNELRARHKGAIILSITPLVS